jgi:hypothetical protein
VNRPEARAMTSDADQVSAKAAGALLVMTGELPKL